MSQNATKIVFPLQTAVKENQKQTVLFPPEIWSLYLIIFY